MDVEQAEQIASRQDFFYQQAVVFDPVAQDRPIFHLGNQLVARPASGRLPRASPSGSNLPGKA